MERYNKVAGNKFLRSSYAKSKEKLQKEQAKSMRYLHVQKEFWKQRAIMELFKDGEIKSAVMNGKRQRLKIKRGFSMRVINGWRIINI